MNDLLTTTNFVITLGVGTIASILGSILAPMIRRRLKSASGAEPQAESPPKAIDEAGISERGALTEERFGPVPVFLEETGGHPGVGLMLLGPDGRHYRTDALGIARVPRAYIGTTVSIRLEEDGREVGEIVIRNPGNEMQRYVL